MKKLILITGLIFFMCSIVSFGQDKETTMKKGKKDQTELYNDFYISYGTGTIYYFIENEGLKANSMSGTFLVGFSRSVNKVIAVGFQLSYTNIDRTGVDNYNYQWPQNIDQKDNMWQGIANVRFRYINTPTFCMYSGIGMGVTMDYYKKTESSITTKGQKLLPAGQLTLLGFRVGRTLSFFGEFGIGTNSILNAGMSYKFGQ